MKKVASNSRKSKHNQKRKKRRFKKKTSTYRVRNWSVYHEALKQRGSLTFWFCEEVVEKWRYQGPRKRGAQFHYSDLAIQTALIFRILFDLPLRQTEGFLQSLVKLMGLTLGVPDYSTLSRRQKTLSVDLPRRKNFAPVFVVIDSTGTKVYGEGEWKVRQHGWSKHRTWRKLHLAVDEETGEILASTLTTNATIDAHQVEPLLSKIDRPITALSADSAYDKWTVYDTLKNRDCSFAITKIWPKTDITYCYH